MHVYLNIPLYQQGRNLVVPSVGRGVRGGVPFVVHGIQSGVLRDQ